MAELACAACKDTTTRTEPARKVETRPPMTEAAITDVIEGILDDWLGDAEPPNRHREIAEALTESWLKDRARATSQGPMTTGSYPPEVDHG